MYVARKAPAGPQTRAEAWRPSLEHAWLAALVVLCALFFHAYVAVTPGTTRAHD